ncbi:MAG: amidohydrolase [Gemmatimonadetes bacterium]|nr:amidohydrolase [Gemmatimonadota bacterium]
MAAIADTLFLGALVVTMDRDDRRIDDGAVAVRDGEIVAVGRRSELETIEADETIDATDHILMPGLINGHLHMGDSLFRSLVEDLPLEPWLERLWISERAFVTHENVSLGARLALCEMIRSGTTSGLDMFWFPEAGADAAIEAGFRLVTGPILFDFDGPDGIANEDRIAVGERWLDRYDDEPLIRACVQPHNHLTVSPEGMQAARRLANDAGALFHTHCSETATEVGSTRERFGRTPMAHLDDLGILEGPTALAHCVHLTDDDFDRLARSGAAVLHNPLSNLKLGSGIAEVARMLERDIPVLIGTDGPVSSNDLDMWTAMRFAGLLQRGHRQDSTLTPAREIVRMVTSAGARALGLGDVVGRVAVGLRADLILIDLAAPHLTPMFDPYAHLVYAVGRDDVRSVMIDGAFVLRDRVLTTLDEDAVLSEVRTLADQIRVHAASVAGTDVS